MFIKNVIIIFVLLSTSLTVSAQQKIPRDFPDRTVDSVIVNNGFDWNGSIVEMPIYNPTWPDTQILVIEPSEKWIYNMPIVGKKEKESYSDKSGKYPLKKWPGDVNKDQKDQPADQE